MLNHRSKSHATAPAKPIFEHFPLTGGVNNVYDPRDIGDFQIAEGFNVDLFDPTRPRTRWGYKRLGWGGQGIPTTTMKCAKGGVSELNVGPSSRLVVAAYPGTDGGLYYATTPDAKVATRAEVTKGPEGASLPSSFDPGQTVSMFQGNDMLWVLPDGANAHVLSPDGTLTNCGNSSQSPPFAPVDGVYMLERVWLLKDDRIYYSKLLPVDDDLAPAAAAFDRDLQTLTLSPERGADARALVAWRDGSLIAFYHDHIEQIIVNSAVPALSQRVILSTNLGTISPRTVLSIGDEVLFIDQYGRFRALQRTTYGTLQASRPLPVSEPIRNEFPARCEQADWDKIWMLWHDDRIFVFYPRDGAVDPNASVNLIMPAPYGLEPKSALPNGWRWEAPWVYAHPMAHGISSSIRRGAFELFTADGTEDGSHRMFAFGDKERLDDGEGISMSITSKMFAKGSQKEFGHVIGRWGLTFDGDVGAGATVSMRTKLFQDFVPVGYKAVEDAGALDAGTHFPIDIDDDFPLDIDDDFPLVFARPKETRLRKVAPELLDVSSIPSGPGAMPQGSPALPNYGPGLIERGHGAQYKIVSEHRGKRFEMVAMTMEVTAHDATSDWDEEI